MAEQLAPFAAVEVCPTRVIPQDLSPYSMIILVRWKAAYAVLDRIPDSCKLVLCFYSHYLWRTYKKEFDAAVARADVITGSSKLLVADIQKETGRKVEYLSDGVDTEVFHPGDRVVGSGPTIRIGWAGNSKEARTIKNLTLLRSAVAHVPNVELVIADIATCDRLPFTSMPAWYQQLDVIVCVSKTEGTPNPALEGAASGLAIISTRVGIVPEFLEESGGGVLLDSASQADIVRGLQELVQKRGLLQHWGRKNRETTLRSWTWEKRLVPIKSIVGTEPVEDKPNPNREYLLTEIRDCRILKPKTVQDMIMEHDQYQGTKRPKVVVYSGFRFASRTVHLIKRLTKDYQFVFRGKPYPDDVDAIASWVTYPFLDGVFAMEAKRLFGTPYVVTCRGQFWHMSAATIKTAIKVYENASVIVSLTRALLNELYARWPRLKMIPAAVIPNGQEIAEIDGSAPPIFNGFPGPHIVTSTNFNFIEKKRATDELVTAFDRSGFTGTFVIAGGGTYSYQTGRVGQSSRYIGFVENISGFLHAGDAFLYSSYMDSQPTVVMEALAAAKPIILRRTPSTGTHELVEHGVSGIVCTSAEECVREAIEVVSSPDRMASLSAAASSRVKSMYSWDQAAGKYRDVFMELIRGAR